MNHECKSQSTINTRMHFVASLFLDRLGRQGSTESFSILLKYPTFEGGFLHIFMGKKILKIEILQKLINIKVRKLSILA